jgi:hypothetical protein
MSTAEDHTSDASGMAEQQGQGRWLSGLREGYAEIGDVRCITSRPVTGR